MAENVYTVSLAKLIKEFNLEVIYLPKPAEGIPTTTADVNRPGLQLVGYFDYFDYQRIQILGKSEFAYMGRLSADELKSCLETFFSHKPPVIVVTRGLEIFDCMRETAEKYSVPLVRTSDGTSAFLSSLISTLNVELAPRITRHGVLVEVYGEGVLIFGDSGVGKSETAIELIKRGHRLIAASPARRWWAAPRTISAILWSCGGSESSTPDGCSAWGP